MTLRRPCDPVLAAAWDADDLAALTVVEAGGTVLGSECLDGGARRYLRVVDVVVELVEGLLHFRVSADLWTDWDSRAVGLHEEVAMVRRADEHARGIGETGAGKREHRE